MEFSVQGAVFIEKKKTENCFKYLLRGDIGFPIIIISG